MDYQGKVTASIKTPNPISFQRNHDKLVWIYGARDSGKIDSSSFKSFELLPSLNILNLSIEYYRSFNNRQKTHTKLTGDSAIYQYAITDQRGCGTNTTFSTTWYVITRNIDRKNRKVFETITTLATGATEDTVKSIWFYNKKDYLELYVKNYKTIDKESKSDSITYKYNFKHKRLSKLTITLRKDNKIDSTESKEYYYLYNKNGQLKQKVIGRLGRKIPNLYVVERAFKVDYSIDSLEKVKELDIETDDYTDSINYIFEERINMESEHMDSTFKLYSFDAEEYLYYQGNIHLTYFSKDNNLPEFTQNDSIGYDSINRIKTIITYDKYEVRQQYDFEYDSISGKVKSYKYANSQSYLNNEQYFFEYDSQGRINKILKLDKYFDYDNEDLKNEKAPLFVLVYKG